MYCKSVSLCIIFTVLICTECQSSGPPNSILMIPGYEPTAHYDIEFITADGLKCSSLHSLIDTPRDKSNFKAAGSKSSQPQKIEVPSEMIEAVERFVAGYTALATEELENEKQNPYGIISKSYFKEWVQRQLLDFDSKKDFVSNPEKRCTLYLGLSGEKNIVLDSVLILSPYMSRYANIASDTFALPALRILSDGSTSTLKIISLATVSGKARALLEADPEMQLLLECDKNGVSKYMHLMLSEPASSVNEFAEKMIAKFVTTIDSSNTKLLSKNNLESAFKKAGADGFFFRKLSAKFANGSIKQAFDALGSTLKGSPVPLSSYVKTSYAFSREAKKLPKNTLDWIRVNVLAEMVFVAFDSCGCHLVDGNDALNIMTSVTSNFELLGYQKNLEVAQKAEASNFADAMFLKEEDLMILCDEQFAELGGGGWLKFERGKNLLSSNLPEKPEDPFVVFAENKSKEAYDLAMNSLENWTERISDWEQKAEAMAAQGALASLYIKNANLTLSYNGGGAMEIAVGFYTKARQAVGAGGQVHPAGYQQTKAWVHYSENIRNWELKRASLIQAITEGIQSKRDKIKFFIRASNGGRDRDTKNEGSTSFKEEDPPHFVMPSIQLFL